MGKPYASELDQLQEVYAWAFHLDVGRLADAVASLARAPLMVVGSGGSLTAAQVAVYLHQRFAQRLARAATPLEVTSAAPLQEAGVLVVTAGGRNPDVIGAVRFLAEREPRELSIVCAAIGTPLARVAKEYWYARFIDFRPPSGKDGFVATNTLIATTVLLARAYGLAYGNKADLPPAIEQLFGGDAAFNTFLKTVCD